jgi:hypothetical protein
MFSLFDEQGRPSQRLIELSIEAAEQMLELQLEEDRPGEECRLLAGLMLALAPKKTVIIGQDNSTAKRVIQKHLPAGGEVLTVESDLLDVSGAADADFILIQGPADGEFEAWAFEELGNVRFYKQPIVMLNDTRLWPMLRFCRNLRYPKLDMTSFGRWSGTLLVELV